MVCNFRFVLLNNNNNNNFASLTCKLLCRFESFSPTYSPRLVFIFVSFGCSSLWPFVGYFLFGDLLVYRLLNYVGEC